MTEETRSGARIEGSLHVVDGAGVVRMEGRYDTDIEDLWSAVTEPARLARWVAEVAGDLRLGGAFDARFTSSWEGPGRVDVCEPPRRLLVTMSPGEADSTVIEAVLAPDGDATTLVVEERGFPLDELAAHGAGWQAHVEDLATHLGGGSSTGWRDRWRALMPTYADRAQRLS